MAEIRLIDANALRKAFKNHPLCNDIWLQYSRELIDKAPTIPQTIVTEFKGCDNCELERPKGHWINSQVGQTCDRCKEIQFGYDSFRNFCANCGADMRGGTK